FQLEARPAVLGCPAGTTVGRMQNCSPGAHHPSSVSVDERDSEEMTGGPTVLKRPGRAPIGSAKNSSKGAHCGSSVGVYEIDTQERVHGWSGLRHPGDAIRRMQNDSGARVFRSANRPPGVGVGK